MTRSLNVLAKRIYHGTRLLRWNGPVKYLIYIANTAIGNQKSTTVKIGDTEISIRANTPDLDVAISCLSGEFDAAIEHVANQSGLIVDAGGYIGAAAIAFAKKFPNATIVTIEPSTQNFEILRKNTAQYANVLPLNAALSSSSGKITLHSRKTGEHGFTTIAEPDDSVALPVGEVETVTIQDILKLANTDSISLLKVDIEGGELDLFSQSQGWVSRCDVILVELHDRIQPGCTRAYINATQTGRKDVSGRGEKLVSVAISAL